MKKIAWFSIVLFSIMLMGCSGGSYSISVGNVTSSSTSISGDYNRFSGYYFKKVKLSKGDTIHFNYTVNTKKGSLSAKMVNSSGEVINEISEDASVKIPETDAYKIMVEAKKHQGSFLLTWDTKSAE